MKKTDHYLYNTWLKMRSRCNNSNDTNYPYYGGRGISVCPEWDDFWKFVEDLGDRPAGFTLDRIDNSKGYSKSNCRWASWDEQNNNRRSNAIRKRKSNAKGFWKTRNGKFQAEIWEGTTKANLGTYDCPLMAHLAYIDAAQTI